MVRWPTFSATCRWPSWRAGHERDPCLARPALSARRDVGRRGRQLRPLLRARDRGRALPVRLARRRARVGPDPAARADRPGLARLPARRAARAALRLPRPRPLRAGRTGTASTRTSSCSIPTPRRSAATDPWADEMFGYRIGDPAEDLSFDERDNAPLAPAGRGRRPGLHLGRRPRRRARPGTRRSSTSCTSRASRSCTPACRRQLRGTYAGLATEPPIEHLTRAGRHRRRAACRSITTSTTGTSSRRGSRTTGATTPSRFFAPDIRYAATATPAGRGPRVQDDGARAARGGHRGDPRRGLQPHRRGQPPGPDPLAAGHRQRRPTTASCRTSRRYYMDYTGCGNTLNMRHPRVLQLIMDSLRYWVLEMHVDGFRFDLASALARELHEVDRLGAFFDIIHQDPVLSQVKLIAEPWDLGRGRLPGRQLPGRLDGVERQVPRRGAPLLEGRRRRRVASWPRGSAGSSDLYEQQRPPALRQHQLRHRARRLHPARSRQLQREAQRGERRGQPRRRERQPELELRRRRADRRPGRATLCASGRSATSWPRCSSRRACRCLRAGDEFGRTQQGNNNAYCQDNEISWLDWELHPGPARAPGLHPPRPRAAAAAAGLPPPQLLPGSGDPRRRGEGPDLVRPGRQRDDGRGLERGVRGRSWSVSPATRSRRRTSAAAGSWTTPSSSS